MRLYLSGPMRSLQDMGATVFARTAAALRDQGHEVYMPTEQEGGDAREGREVRTALAANFDWICMHAEGVVVLPGWRDSRGALAEAATTLALDLPVWVAVEFLLYGPKATGVTR